MKAKELRDMTGDELNAKLKELKNELFNLRFQHAINQLDNPHKIVDVKSMARSSSVPSRSMSATRRTRPASAIR